MTVLDTVLLADSWETVLVVVKMADMAAETYLDLEEIKQVQPAADMLNQVYHGGYI